MTGTTKEQAKDMHDLSKMSSLNEDSVVTVLKARLMTHELIYTRVHRLLVAVNPLKDIPGLYTEERMRLYTEDQNAEPPHAYEVAASAYRRMLDGTDQAVVITGESGAGKTETFKKMIQYLSWRAPTSPMDEGSSVASFEQLLIKTVPALESFGNAATALNHNSSRYGKFVSLYYTRQGRLAGVVLKSYLLEKTRVCAAGGERTFHSFYELVCGAPGDMRHQLKLEALPPSTRYIVNLGQYNAQHTARKRSASMRRGSSSTLLDQLRSRRGSNVAASSPVGQGPMPGRRGSRVPSLADISSAFRRGGGKKEDAPLAPQPYDKRNDGEEFKDTRKAIAACGVDEADEDAVWMCVGALLHLGAVDFVAADKDGAAAKESDTDPEAERSTLTPACQSSLSYAADLLGVDSTALANALTTRKIKAGAEWVTAHNSPKASRQVTDALAKAIYARVFAWLFEVTNWALGGTDATAQAAMADDDDKEHRHDDDGEGKAQTLIGLLDMFGFEAFQHNSLEQLCINVANERLQVHFTRTMFETVQREAMEEGIDFKETDFSAVDPGPTLDLLSTKGTGVMPMISEECYVPRGTDQTLLQKLAEKHKGHERFSLPRQGGRFGIAHYAGIVQYETDGMLDKNRDPLPQDAAVLLSTSGVPFVGAMFTARTGATGTVGKARTRAGVLPAFDAQLRDLSAILEAAESRFVRCIKPNMKQEPGLYDVPVVVKQLRSSAVVAAIETVAAGFPDRVPHAELVRRYTSVAPKEAFHDDERPPDNGKGVEQVLGALGVRRDLYAVGKTKTFLRAGVTQYLERARDAKLIAAAQRIAARHRGRHARFVFQGMLIEKRAKEAAEAAKAAEKKRRQSLVASQAIQEAQLAGGAPQTGVNLSELSMRALQEHESAQKEHEEAIERYRQAEEARLAREEELANDPRAQRLAKLRRAAAASRGGGGADGRRRPPTAPGMAFTFGGALGGDQSDTLFGRSIPFESAEVALKLATELGYTVAELEYGRYLGLQITDADSPDAGLLYIAREGLAADLPDGWEEHLDPEGRVYYANHQTGALSRAHPTDEVYRQQIHDARYGKGSYLSLSLSMVTSTYIVDALGQLRPSQMKRAAAAFEKYDRERVGLISFDDFAAAVHEHATKTGRAEPVALPKVRAMFTTADLTHSGSIDLNEFVHMQKLRQERISKRKEEREAKKKAEEEAAPGQDELGEATWDAGGGKASKSKNRLLAAAAKASMLVGRSSSFIGEREGMGAAPAADDAQKPNGDSARRSVEGANGKAPSPNKPAAAAGAPIVSDDEDGGGGGGCCAPKKKPKKQASTGALRV